MVIRENVDPNHVQKYTNWLCCCHGSILIFNFVGSVFSALLLALITQLLLRESERTGQKYFNILNVCNKYFIYLFFCLRKRMN